MRMIHLHTPGGNGGHPAFGDILERKHDIHDHDSYRDAAVPLVRSCGQAYAWVSLSGCSSLRLLEGGCVLLTPG